MHCRSHHGSDRNAEDESRVRHPLLLLHLLHPGLQELPGDSRSLQEAEFACRAEQTGNIQQNINILSQVSLDTLQYIFLSEISSCNL